MEKSNMQEVNVRVAVRVRPLLPKEKLATDQICVKLVPSSNQLIIGKDKAFTFDYLFSSRSSQDEVYQTCVAPLVKAVFEGYNATVFAYGQTGSGKTFTIGGGNVASQIEEEFGIIPRVVREMFQMMQNDLDHDITLKVSFVEIYKEELRDLLDLSTSSKDLHIREDDKGNTLMIGATEVLCSSMEEVMSCLEQGAAYRSTASTQMNDHSSRSHSIFTIYLEQRWSDCVEEQNGKRRSRYASRGTDEEVVIDEPEELEHYMCAKFHLVDLAGSERANRTGNIGDRFKESVYINSGLLALGNVISALGDVKKRATHIPYRDSKITRFLKDSLGGNAQTLMVCCISPSSSNFEESLNALKYANRARNIKNMPVINKDPHTIRFEEMQSEIKALREELYKQRSTVFTAATDFSDYRNVADQEEIQKLEDKVTRLQKECSHYKMIAEEAYRQLQVISEKDILSQSQNVKLHDWLELMEEIKNRVPSSFTIDTYENQRIQHLEAELAKCKSDLKSDETIFLEKSREISQLKEKVAELEMTVSDLSSNCKEADDKLKQQTEQLVNKEVKLSELEQRLKELQSREADIVTIGDRLFTPSDARRIQSAPMNVHGKLLRKESRHIYTSPAVFSVERMMQSFRARSQLLVNEVEESDEVRQQYFSDDELNNKDVDKDFGSKDEVDRGSQKNTPRQPYEFKRNTSSRGTYTLRRLKSLPVDEQVKLISSASNERSHASYNNEGDPKTMLSLPAIAPNRLKDGAMNGTRLINEDIRQSTDLNRKKLKESELVLRQASRKITDLTINIKLKEQLIRELVKSGKESETMNKQYEQKIRALENDKDDALKDLNALQAALQEVEMKELNDKTEKERIQNDFRRKMEIAKTRMKSLQQKQKETMKMASLTKDNDSKIQDLELAVKKMRQQQEQLQKRLKDEMETKAKLEREMLREQQHVRDLQLANEQQKKVLKVKTDEVTHMQRKFRSGQNTAANSLNRFEEQKKWLDSEVEKMLEQKCQLDELSKELKKREEIIAKREALLAERSELEMKKLRTSQHLTRNLQSVSSRLDVVEKTISEKMQEIAGTPRDKQAAIKDDMEKLVQEKHKLQQTKQSISDKIQRNVVSHSIEQRLSELDEAIETLDATMEYENESITSRREKLKTIVFSSENDNALVSRLQSLSATESKLLLAKYFEKVVETKDVQRRKELLISELEVKVEEQEALIREMEQNLQKSALEADRKLTQQQQDYERKMQLIMQQLSETKGGVHSDTNDSYTDSRIQLLEKDLYYYKKTSRDLKKKLREVLLSITPAVATAAISSGGDGLVNRPPSLSIGGDTPRLIGETPRDIGHYQINSGITSATPRTLTSGISSARPDGAASVGNSRTYDAEHYSDRQSENNKIAADRISGRRESVEGAKISSKGGEKHPMEHQSSHRSQAREDAASSENIPNIRLSHKESVSNAKKSHGRGDNGSSFQADSLDT